jgi:hypothetical protein
MAIRLISENRLHRDDHFLSLHQTHKFEFFIENKVSSVYQKYAIFFRLNIKFQDTMESLKSAQKHLEIARETLLFKSVSKRLSHHLSPLQLSNGNSAINKAELDAYRNAHAAVDKSKKQVYLARLAFKVGVGKLVQKDIIIAIDYLYKITATKIEKSAFSTPSTFFHYLKEVERSNIQNQYFKKFPLYMEWIKSKSLLEK